MPVFCSDDCRKNQRVKKICLNCGKEFYVIPSRAEKAKFCSKNCYDAWRIKRIKKICPVCGKEFDVPACEKNRIYCSKQCADIGKSKKIIKTCLFCGKKFAVKPSRKNAHFCSKTCADKYWRGKPKNRLGYFDDELREYIDGLLLGDGGMYTKVGMISAYYQQGFAVKYEEWATKIKKDFKKYGIKSRISKAISKSNLHNKCVISYQVNLRTKSYYEFLEFRERWYPNDRKIVPKDLRLTPTVVLNWYLGDGCLVAGRHGYYIILHTNSFTVEEVSYLISQIKKNVEVIPKLRIIRRKYPVIYISRKKQVLRFLDYIGDCPVKCFEYKWQI